MTHPLRIAVQLHPQHAEYRQIRDAVHRAEDIGVDIVFNWDHFYPLYGEPDGKHFECWSMLAAWAEQTERVELGALVTCNSYRNPELLADMARTVDHISNGRLILGIGSGWFERDYEEYGFPFGTARQRLADLERDLPIIKDRLAQLTPGPVGDMPILIGGSGEKVTLRLVAQHADAWNTFGPPDNFAAKNRVLNEWCESERRNPADIERTVGISVDEVDQLNAYAEAGADHVIFMVGAPFDLDPVAQALDAR